MTGRHPKTMGENQQKPTERAIGRKAETLPLKHKPKSKHPDTSQNPKGGRPTSFTPERTRRVLEAIRSGATYIRAAEVAGVDYSTLRAWIKRGEETRRGPYHEFSESIKKAEVDREETLLQSIIDAGKDPRYWQARAWVLERTNPEKYGRREKREITGAEGGPVQVRMMTDEELLAAAKKALGKVKE